MPASNDPNAPAPNDNNNPDDPGAPTAPDPSAPSNTSGGRGPSKSNIPTSVLGTLLGPFLKNPNAINAIADLIGVGGQIGGAALSNARIQDAIDYLKQIGATTQGQQAPSFGAGWNAFGNQNNVINSLFDFSNPMMQLLTSGVVGNNNWLNGQLSGMLGGNTIYQDPTATSLLNLETRPTDFLTGQAEAAGNLVRGGGQTANNQSIAQRGLQLASGNPLLTPGQAASFAVDNAGRANANAAETARAQAMARGGGPGAVAANGASNQGLADFAGTAAPNVANALQQSLLGQQGLRLQQTLGGLGAAQGGTALQQSLMGTGFNAGLANATGASGILQQAIGDLLSGRTSAANIGSTLAQLYQGQNQQLLNTANSGIGALLSGAGLSGQQGNSFLNYAASLMDSLGGTGRSIAGMLSNSPWSTFLNNLGALAQPAQGGGGGNSALNTLINAGVHAVSSHIPGVSTLGPISFGPQDGGWGWGGSLPLGWGGGGGGGYGGGPPSDWTFLND